MSAAATLAEARELHFQEEYQRLLRALFESVDKESSLLRELRQMKEALVAVALRLQVSHQVNKMDETTMFELRKEVSDARMSALSANKQFAEATDVIISLKREIGSLKRQVRDVRNMDIPDPNAAPRLTAPPDAAKAASLKSSEKQGGGAPINLGGQSAFGAQADNEVDELMSTPLYKPRAAGPGGKLPSPLKSNQTTPFQEWKMQQYLYAPDTLEGSRNHDPLVVQLLHAAATASAAGHATQTGNSLFDRSTKSITAKGHAPDSKAAAEAKELAESLAGLNLPAMHRKMKKSREKGTKNIWALNPPEQSKLLSRDPIALKRLASPAKGASGSRGHSPENQRGSSGGSVVI